MVPGPVGVVCRTDLQAVRDGRPDSGNALTGSPGGRVPPLRRGAWGVGHPLCPTKAERRLWVRAREGAAVSTHRAPRRLRAGSALAVIIAKITDCGHVPVF